MSSNDLATVTVSEIVEPVKRAGHDLHPRLVDVAARGPLVGKFPQAAALGFERHRNSGKLLRQIETLIHMVVSVARTFSSGVIRLGLFAGSGGLSKALLTLVVLTILCVGDPSPTPTPTPTPIPF